MNTAQPPILNHLKLAHHLWDLILSSGDWALDATCGNGHDALFLNERVEKLFCMDIQEAAIEQTRLKVPEALFYKGCHSQLPDEAFGPKLKLITYNLGYLPGSDKSLTTTLETTQQSLEMALDCIPLGGMISITFYPGHTEGLKEFSCLLPYLENLDPKSFCVSKHTWINRNNSPVLVFILKLN